MIRTYAPFRVEADRIPRESGDDPTETKGEVARIVYSPRERG